LPGRKTGDTLLAFAPVIVEARKPFGELVLSSQGRFLVNGLSPVEHVHVHKGGQAIVGTVQTGGGVPANSEVDPMHQLSHMNQAKRCRATSKRSGKPCQSPAVRPIFYSWSPVEARKPAEIRRF
jgi:hypothetical protein